MTNQSILTLVIAGALSFGAQAESYLGGSLGMATFKNAAGNANTSYGSGSMDLELEDDQSVAGSIYGGYQFNSFLAIEGAIGGYDALEDTYVTVGNMHFLSIQPKLSFALTDTFDLYAKAGLAYFNAEFKVSNALLNQPGYTTLSDSTVTGMYGLGEELKISPKFHIRAS
ncbi:outer membrane beta-barrel protein [Vibrio navarrensis]|uniref:outer membrane beta-barrel protein n=1 Tax=Vibrio navarrensis TaxID=29495 RepID=UPI001D0538AC|nr:outer membrane beta-barrel protein [Vibrio navarrensis]